MKQGSNQLQGMAATVSAGMPDLAQRQVVDSAPDGILVVDGQGVIRFANPAMVALCGHQPSELVGQSIDMLMTLDVRLRHRDHMVKYFSNPYARTMGQFGRLRLLHRDAREVPVDISLGHGVADDGAPYAILFVRDATVVNSQRQMLEQMAMQDPLTGLYNRRMFMAQLGQALDHSRRTQSSVAVCLVDLDDFKSINDGYGHEHGDALLKVTAQRLRECLRAGDVLARLGGDEFAVLLRDVSNPEDAIQVARKIVSQLQVPICLSDGTVCSGCSVGVAYAPQDADDSTTLMRYVDMALYRAKDAGRGTFAVYDPMMACQLADNLKLKERLQRAMEGRKLQLHYQPQVSVNGSDVTGVEALLRWHDDELGWVTPDRFIAVAEATGLILPLGDWVLEEACRQIAAWRAQGLLLPVAVNVSAQQFRKGDLADQVAKLLDRFEVPAHLLELEITETVAMNDPEAGGHTLRKLAELGVGVALDDFGRGHSSLLYLLQLPVTRVKIDRLFVSGIPDSEDHVRLTRAIIGLAATLGKSVVAEGVETPDQLAFLQREGCVSCQGWYFSRAVPTHDLPLTKLRLESAGHMWQTGGQLN